MRGFFCPLCAGFVGACGRFLYAQWLVGGLDLAMANLVVPNLAGSDATSADTRHIDRSPANRER